MKLANMAGYANKTDRTRRVARYHYLSGCVAGRMVYNVTRILRLTKTPTQKFAWRRAHAFYARVQLFRRALERWDVPAVPVDEDRSQDA